jgi:hypothetical protein
MKIMRTVIIPLVASLFLAPLLYGQDLSKYRDFSFGMSLPDLSKQIDKNSIDVIVVQERPALIQQLTWRPTAAGSSHPDESASEILFSFYNGKLYRIDVTYDATATMGLTAADMARAISADYGTPTTPAAEISFPTDAYASSEKVLDRWEDSQYSASLFRSSLTETFALAIFAKPMNAEAEAAIAQAAKLDQQEAPGKELARAKKASDDLEATRQKDIKAFQP